MNNIYVSARNHDFDPMHYVRGIPADRIQQIHLAGHSDLGDYVIDTHDHPVADAVWQLYQQVITLIGERATMIERDDRYPPFAELLAELDQARTLAKRALLTTASDKPQSAPQAGNCAQPGISSRPG